MTPVHAAETVISTVKNCVHMTTGEARLVSSKITKCLRNEKLVKIALPQLLPESHMHAGAGAPIDVIIGHDGDFYIDTKTKTLYGPRIGGMWGAGVSMVGEVGPIGKTGSALLSGITPPDSSTGIVGDFYLDINAKIIYGPKSERAGWGVGSPITGPQGSPGVSGPQGPQGPAGAPGAAGGFGAYGSFYDTTTVTLTQSTATPIPLGVTAFSNQVAIIDGSKIQVNRSGKFNIAFSSQITKEDNGDDVISIWLCKGANGGACTNLPWSNTDMLFSGLNARHVAAWNFFVEASAGEYFQLMISSSGTTLKTKILSAPAQSAPTRPEIPGTILTVNQVG